MNRTTDDMWDDDTAKTPPQLCPYCGYHLDAASALFENGARPTEGDVSVCLSCAQVLIFNADSSLRKLTKKELTELKATPTYNDVLRAQFAVRSIDRRDLKGNKP